MDTGKKKRKNLLSIDGGISGLPALYILDEMISRLQFDLKSDDEVLPCEHFDMIVATGPGALVALLIGKLRLTTSKAMEAYEKLVTALPVKAAKDDEERKINSDIFEKAFIEVLEDAGFNAKSPMVDDKDVKIMICTSNTSNVTALSPIRSYRTRGASPPPCTILQTARASIAFPDSGRIRQSYKTNLTRSPGSIGEVVEAATIMSIGSGKVEMRVDGIDEGLKRGSALSEQVHEELQTRLGTANIYYRFNVEKLLGLESETIFEAVSAYLGERMINNRLDEATESIHSRPRGQPLRNINSISAVEIALKPRPSLVSHFIGRQDILGAMHSNHIDNRSTELQTPAITVLSGIGGSGKTQTALKFALDFEKLFPGVSVFFVNASSEDNLKADLETIIRSYGSSYRTKSFEDALIYLANEVKNWLMIFDNADDPSVRLFPFIPKCTSGNLIITTRNSNHAILSPNSHHHIEGLATDEAIELVLTLSRNEKTETNRAIAHQIVDELGCLPLALAQAGGYIFVNKCLSRYLDLYHKNRAELLESSEVELPQDYQSTVATTIRMSMNQLPAEAQDLMRLFAALDAASIAHEIIAKAASRQFRSVVWTKEGDIDSRTLEHARILMKILCPSGEWSEVGFGKMIRQCLQYSLLRLTTQGEAKFYSMHVLVQSYLQSHQQPLQGYRVGVLIIRLLGASTTYGILYEYLAFNRLLAPHLKQIDKGDIIEPGDHFGFGQVFYDVGDKRISISHTERCVEIWRKSLGEEHNVTLAAMVDLSIYYKETGSIRRALEVDKKVLEVDKRRYGSEDQNTLIDMSNLASSYRSNGQLQEALKLDEEVLEMRTRKFGTKHLDTLASMNNLALCYHVLGRHQESLELREKVAEMRKSVLGPEHPETLLAKSNLAVSYRAVRRHEEALRLDEEAVETQKRVLGSEHPSTLLSMTNLSVSYWNVGRCIESLELGQATLELHIRILGYEDPQTVEAMRIQLRILRKLGMKTEMDELLQVACPLYEKVLGVDHPDTLSFNREFKEYIDALDSH